MQLALEKTIRLALELKEKTIIQEVLSRGIDVAIVGDNDFYSQSATVKIHLPLLHHYLSDRGLACIIEPIKDAGVFKKDQTLQQDWHCTIRCT